MHRQLTRRQVIHAAGLILAAALVTISSMWSGSAIAQAAYPAGKVVTIITPFGSSTEIFARIVAEHLTKRLGGTFIVEQKLGAGGTIGTAYLSKQKPDGYTLGIGLNSTLSVAPHVYKRINYEPRELTYLAGLMTAQSVLLAAPNIGVKSPRDLVELSKNRSLNYGSPGVGSSMHLGVEQFNSAAHITKAVHVPFKTTETLATALMVGDIDYYMSVTSVSKELVKAGKFTAIAVSGQTRNPDLPSVPTFAEVGLGSIDLDVLYGVIAPPGLPREIGDRLVGALQAMGADPEFRATIQRTGNFPVSLMGDSFKKAIIEDISRQGQVVKGIGIEPQ